MDPVVLESIAKKFLLQNPAHHEFWALKDITFVIPRGKVVGVIGRNGAGKTTLLNILAGISVPTMGNLKISGRVSSLLTLGAGFQEELSGRENIYLNGYILGMNKEQINQKYNSIIEFSELDGFINQPLRTYSQGMKLRLGFSISIHVEFDILVIDEIISVGDVSFQKKCYESVMRFKRQGKTMVVSMQSVDMAERLCDEVMLLEHGRIVSMGEPEYVTRCYLKLLEEKNLFESYDC